MSSNFGDIWERYAAALVLECFDNADIAVMVAIGRRLSAEGNDPWEAPVRIGVPSQA